MPALPHLLTALLCRLALAPSPAVHHGLAQPVAAPQLPLVPPGAHQYRRCSWLGAGGNVATPRC